MAIHSLSTLRVPTDGPQRGLPKGVSIKADSFWQRFDRDTLIYDVIYIPSKREVRAILPRSIGLEDVLKRVKIRIDHRPARRFKWRKWRRHEMIVFKGIDHAKEISFEFGGETVSLPINTVDTTFAGLNCIYTLSKDNDLRWVRDWVQFHVRQHQLQGVVIFDNGSTTYTPSDLYETLRSIDGIAAAAVVSVDLPLGPLFEDCTNRSDAKFLQVAMLNLARDRFLSSSRAWLNLDIDELLLSPTGESIFDATVKNRWGHLTFPGVWHYPDDPNAPATHAVHRLIRPGDRPCPTKYSLRPDGIFGDFALQVHSLDRIHRKFSFAPARFWFMHCHGISTSWKYARTGPDGPFSPASDLAQRALDAGLDT